jgi:hypothetical protein
MNDERRNEPERPEERGVMEDESGIIVFGGGGRGCSTTGCLFWLLISAALSIGLTLLANFAFFLF